MCKRHFFQPFDCYIASASKVQASVGGPLIAGNGSLRGTAGSAGDCLSSAVWWLLVCDCRRKVWQCPEAHHGRGHHDHWLSAGVVNVDFYTLAPLASVTRNHHAHCYLFYVHIVGHCLEGKSLFVCASGLHQGSAGSSRPTGHQQCCQHPSCGRAFLKPRPAARRQHRHFHGSGEQPSGPRACARASTD